LAKIRYTATLEQASEWLTKALMKELPEPLDVLECNITRDRHGACEAHIMLMGGTQGVCLKHYDVFGLDKLDMTHIARTATRDYVKGALD
jgi:hypothetical protein